MCAVSDDDLANTPAPADIEIPKDVIQKVGEAMEDWYFHMHGAVTSHRPGVHRNGEEARKVIEAAYPTIRQMLGYEAVYELGKAEGEIAAIEKFEKTTRKASRE